MVRITKLSQKFTVEIEFAQSIGMWQAVARNAAESEEGKMASFVGNGETPWRALDFLAEAMYRGHRNGIEP